MNEIMPPPSPPSPRADERPYTLAFTARTERGMAAECAATGIDALLFKPASLQQLAAALAAALPAR